MDSAPRSVFQGKLTGRMRIRSEQRGPVSWPEQLITYRCDRVMSFIATPSEHKVDDGQTTSMDSKTGRITVAQMAEGYVVAA